MYLGIDVWSMLNLEAKTCIRTMLANNVKLAREQLCHFCINILGHYRKTVSVNSSSTQFVIPESMKVFIVCVLGLLKSPAFALMEDAKLDQKVADFTQLSSCSLAHFLAKMYPKMYSISTIINPENKFCTYISNETDGTISNSIVKPNNIPCSIDKIVDTDVVLIANSDYIYIYLPEKANDEIIQQVLFSVIVN